jgi:hypothetical protein
VIESARSTVPV